MAPFWEKRIEYHKFSCDYLHPCTISLLNLSLFSGDFMEDVFHTGNNLECPAVREKGDLYKYYVVFAQNKGNC